MGGGEKKKKKKKISIVARGIAQVPMSQTAIMGTPQFDDSIYINISTDVHERGGQGRKIIIPFRRFHYKKSCLCRCLGFLLLLLGLFLLGIAPEETRLPAGTRQSGWWPSSR